MIQNKRPNQLVKNEYFGIQRDDGLLGVFVHGVLQECFCDGRMSIGIHNQSNAVQTILPACITLATGNDFAITAAQSPTPFPISRSSRTQTPDGRLVNLELHKGNSLKNQHIEGWKAQTQYACEYMHQGRKWALNFFAVDDEDAALKLESIKSSLIVLGVIHEVIPCGL